MVCADGCVDTAEITMKITSIRAQVKNSERASIFIDGKYAFSLSLNELVNEKLKIGQELSESESKRLKKLSDDGKLKARALEWLLNRPRSVREFKDYLYHKKVEPEQISSLVEDLLAKGYLDEEKFSAWLIDFRRRMGKSERAIKNELLKKGVAREVMASAFEEGEGSELERLKALVGKKAKLSRYKNDQQKLKQYLIRQGFNYQDVKTVLSSGQS